MVLKLCSCGQVKAQGLRTLCFECWLSKQDMIVQVRYAERRLESVPKALWVSSIPKSDWPVGRRWCSGCQTFVRLKDCAAKASRCKACNSNAAHSRMVERTYGITEIEYRKLFAAQDGLCYICQRESHSKRLAVDHDHETGKVRGLLCPDVERGCNYAILGNIIGKTKQEKVAMVYRIAEYILNPPASKILDSGTSAMR